MQCLDEAYRLFRSAENDHEASNCSFNIAKILYEKTSVLMDSFGFDQEKGPITRKLYLEDIKEEVLALLKETKNRVKRFERTTF